ncbi:hypothetical protein DP116_11280 [Brasilonema bromeliae SPC951]|uniref:Transposase n=1 Tax=Brasilonema bromeliae SPC951 TaxID=385972 RepID=A0ABX1P6K4_9CYAN|nr:hypothetical protein [Brasilonema bromeliae SPC951]
MLFDAIIEREESLQELICDFDSTAAKIIQSCGLCLMSKLLNNLSHQVTQEAKTKELVIHRVKKIKYAVIFGELEVPSPYLWNKKAKSGFCPVPKSLGIEHGGRSKAVKKALTDFGIEESFGQASKRFVEHYGWEVERASVRREVEAIASTALDYVEKRLESASDEPIQQKEETVSRLLVELDGSHVRTGVVQPKPEQKDSKRRNKTRLRIAKKHNKIADTRKDFLHKLSSKIVRENQAIVLEDLNVSGMVKNRKLARAISLQGWREFRVLCEAKSDKFGRTFKVISRWEPTSQTCFDCGYRWGKLDLKVRTVTCLQCSATHDRDENAAKNIEKVGIGNCHDSKRTHRGRKTVLAADLNEASRITAPLGR